MANSLAPAFVRINYQTAYGRHVMTLPSVPIILNDDGDHVREFELRGLETPVTVQSAVTDFVNVLKGWFNSDTTFIDYIAYAQATPESVPTPVESNSLGIVGAPTHTGGVTGSIDKATQRTYTWRTEAFGLFKIVMLDTSISDWDKITSKANGQVAALDAYVTADASWLSGRDGAQPGAFLGLTKTLNEKLRRAYGMT